MIHDLTIKSIAVPLPFRRQGVVITEFPSQRMGNGWVGRWDGSCVSRTLGTELCQSGAWAGDVTVECRVGTVSIRPWGGSWQPMILLMATGIRQDVKTSIGWQGVQTVCLYHLHRQSQQASRLMLHTCVNCTWNVVLSLVNWLCAVKYR